MTTKPTLSAVEVIKIHPLPWSVRRNKHTATILDKCGKSVGCLTLSRYGHAQETRSRNWASAEFMVECVNALHPKGNE